jgi:hypothetical protein
MVSAAPVAGGRPDQEYETKIAALERVVSRQAPETELMN